MPRSFLVKTKQQQQHRHDVMDTDIKADDIDDVSTKRLQQRHPGDVQSQTNDGMGKKEHMCTNSSDDVKQVTMRDTVIIDSRLDCRSLQPSPVSTQMAHHCNMTLQSSAADAAARSHILASMTSSQPHFRVYPDTLAWLRQLHAMCARADHQPFPFPPLSTAASLPAPTRHCPATLQEPVYYVTKMAAMQPFDPRWASCPSPSTAPASVDVRATRPARAPAPRDFSIPSILAGSCGGTAGSASSTGVDSESEERSCHSTSSSVDEPCPDGPRRCHVVTSYDHVTRHDLMSHPRQRQQVDKPTFECPQCNKVYGTMGALKMHVRTHTLPCRCPLCGKAFSRPWLLQGHVRTHTGERPFRCSDCDRAFADRSNLRAHAQTHAGVKRYRCQTCNKPFSRMSLLAKHQDTAACRPAVG